MIQKISLLLLVLFPTTTLLAQKKVLDHDDYKIWGTVQDEIIAADGSHVAYSIERGEKDHFLKVQDDKGNFVLEYDRGEKGQFTYDSKYTIFTIKAWKDSVVSLKKRRVKKKDLPKDSLGIFNLENKSLTKLGNIKSYKIPEKWSGYLAYQLEEIKKEKKKEEEKILRKQMKRKKTNLRKWVKTTGIISC